MHPAPLFSPPPPHFSQTSFIQWPDSSSILLWPSNSQRGTSGTFVCILSHLSLVFRPPANWNFKLSFSPPPPTPPPPQSFTLPPLLITWVIKISRFITVVEFSKWDIFMGKKRNIYTYYTEFFFFFAKIIRCDANCKNNAKIFFLYYIFDNISS